MKNLMETLVTWAELGALRSLDLALTRFIQQQLPDSSDAVLLAVALVSERNAHGHVCLDLQAALNNPQSLLTTTNENTAKDELAALLNPLSLASWVAELKASSAVNQANSPLVLAGIDKQPLLYLRRYWHYEQQIKAALAQRLAVQQTLPEVATQKLLARLFPAADLPTATDWQKVACLLAARSNFSIITGGPGTGKTTTVVKLLALLQGLRLSNHETPLQIHLAAPTGKAAARLSESIAGSIERLALSNNLDLPENLATDIKSKIPKEVTTLHRLLGSLPNTRSFRHHATNPLPTDCVVVDEASMMDVEMMAKLVAALPSTARLILLGDKDQLASVEAGSVLGDLCQTAATGHYTPATKAWVQRLSNEQLADGYIDEQGTALQQATCMLRHSYRFSAHPGIGELAQAVNTGKTTVNKLKACFKNNPDSLNNLLLKTTSDPYKVYLAPLEQLAVKGYQGYLTTLQTLQPTQANTSPAELEDWALKVFAAHNQFQLLTAVRQGFFGVESLNQQIVKALQSKNLLPEGVSFWYSGRPLLVTRNDYSLKLMNGDIGICMMWPKKGLRVAFPNGKQGIRWVLPSRLQGIETVFAMTVHKSQGSEFTHTALVLPDFGNPVLTKELIYTGITRSKEKFTLIHSKDSVLQQALNSQVERVSGLTTLST
ncbi:MAG TPA: exodeoxyribonuclease V subunit alpha [Marinospirillum sp.]|uniref:exodeoxyribonuclease V subunit alpha n=1 Tax=Marinospirillum sp. TaxID=2183934 RepID=UPI002B47B980|nr:exodeoxyribonuclease V subunit alpha [Marinospirillum sp.]HKM15362.1 exodeoxyribonuclease V subunit alpha [Marinospirillum sp.]